MSSTPIPPTPMDNIAIDIFYMNPVKYHGRILDAMVIIVDRHSGWITAFPENRKGLTARKIARQCFLHHWDIFGIPRVVTSDRGPQFASNFWKALCAHFGVQNVFCHVGWHQGNGRAEVAGKILKNFMRKIGSEHPEWNWVELLQPALRKIRQAPGESGLSPHQILFGRDPPLPGIPLPSPQTSELASDFFERIKD